MEVPAILCLVCAILSLPLLAVSLHLRRRHRLLSDLPTSKARGVFIGLVEIKGTAECEAPLHGYLSGRSCVQYAWQVDEQWTRTVTETYTDKDGKVQTRTRQETGWTKVDGGGESQPFYVRDDTGVVLVRPGGAKLEPATFFGETVGRGDPLYYGKGPAGAVPDSDHRRRFSESGLPLHAPLYIVGHARERDDVVAPEIASSPEADLFLISTRTEEKVLRGYGIGSWACWVTGLVAAVVAALFFSSPEVPHPIEPPIAGVAGGATFLLLWGAGWVWMVFNSLVSLRQRVRQGWSLIDVQLKRRHDLIPTLVATLTGLKNHERELQGALAALRTQAEATPPGVAGPDHDGLAGQLRMVAERYPAIAAQPGFLQLQRELIETEQRIALARTYYNDLVTHFATRLERVPDRWVGRITRMQAPVLLVGEAFERAPVTVNFAT